MSSADAIAEPHATHIVASGTTHESNYWSISLRLPSEHLKAARFLPRIHRVMPTSISSTFPSHLLEMLSCIVTVVRYAIQGLPHSIPAVYHPFPTCATTVLPRCSTVNLHHSGQKEITTTVASKENGTNANSDTVQSQGHQHNRYRVRA